MLRRRVLTVIGMVGLVSFGLGCGIAVDRVQAARERAAVLEPYRDALQQRNRQLMAIELQTHGRHEAFQREWRQRLERVHEAVVLGDSRTAVAAWREAYAAAMRGGQWRDLIEVGEAALWVGDVAEFAETAPGAARKSYLTALYRAQAQRSVDGVLQAAEGFAALGDRAAVQNCLVMATRLAEDDPQAQASIRAFSDRFTAGDAQRRVSSSLKRAATIPSSPGSRLNGSTATSSK